MSRLSTNSVIACVICLASVIAPLAHAGPALKLGWRPASVDLGQCRAHAQQVLEDLKLQDAQVSITSAGNLLVKTNEVTILITCIPGSPIVEFALAADSQQQMEDIAQSLFKAL